jgi:hypothetical protein
VDGYCDPLYSISRVIMMGFAAFDVTKVVEISHQVDFHDY